MTNYIYALLDPETNEIRYIGKTDNPSERLKNHLNEQGKWHRINWIKSLKKRGLKPIMQIIEEVVEGTNWEEREKYWIAYYRHIGTNLTNGSDGGDCGPDCTGMHLWKSEETNAKVRAMLIIRNRTPKMRELSRKTGLANRGRKHTLEEIAKMRRASTGRKWRVNDKRRKQLIERNKTQKYNSEIMRENALKLWNDPIKGIELRTKLIERNRTRAKSKAHPFDAV